MPRNLRKPSLAPSAGGNAKSLLIDGPEVASLRWCEYGHISYIYDDRLQFVQNIYQDFSGGC